jgi:hypothetical protein
MFLRFIIFLKIKLQNKTIYSTANSQSSELFYRQQRQEPKRSNTIMKLLHISLFFFNKLEFLTKNLFADEI